MDVEVLERRVRFGDTTYGPHLHYAEVFDWLICAVEELSVELDHSTYELVDAGAIPYAPVEVAAAMDRYPTYGDRVRIDAHPIAVGDRSLHVEYVLIRPDDGTRLGRARVVHVTIGPDGRAEALPDRVADRLRALQDDDRPALAVDLPDAPVAFEPADQTFGIRRTFRTPHVEAVDLGYFEDYARFAAEAMEGHLAQVSRSHRSLAAATDRWPLCPRAWRFTFGDTIEFEDEVAVRAQIEAATPEALTVAYAFDGGRSGGLAGSGQAGGHEDRRIHGRIAYGSCADDGTLGGPLDETLAVLQPSG